MFLYLLAAGLLPHGHNPANEGMYSVGYFLCGVAVIMSIGFLIMAIKLKKLTI